MRSSISKIFLAAASSGLQSSHDCQSCLQQEELQLHISTALPECLGLCLQLQKCKEELQMLQQLRDEDVVRIRVLEANQLAAERLAAEHVKLRSEQEACNKGLQGQLIER